MRVLAFIQLTRPLFLVGGALLYGLGAAIAHSAGWPIDWRRYLLGQIIVTSIQMMTHYANEYFDLEVDRVLGASRTWFSGGSGVLPAGKLAPRVALNAARSMALIALVLIAVTWIVEPAMSVIGIVALFGGWFYSAPPIRLAASGFGELATALITAVFVPLSGIVMQRGPIDARLIAVALPLVLLSIAMLIAFQFSDYDADHQTGKRNLTVRLGRRRAGQLHSGLLLAALAAIWIAASAHWLDPRIAGWSLIALPLAVWQFSIVAWRATRSGRGDWRLHAGGLGLFALTATAFLAGFLVS